MEKRELLNNLIKASQTTMTFFAEPEDREEMWKSAFHFVCRPYRDQFVLIYQKELREAKPSASEYYLNDIAGDYKEGYKYSGFIHTKTEIWYDSPLATLRMFDPVCDYSKAGDIRRLEKEFVAAYKDCLVEKFLQTNPEAESSIDSDSIRYQLHKYILQEIHIPDLTLRDEVEIWKYPPVPDLFEYLLSPESYVEGIADAMLKKKAKELLHENSRLLKMKSEYKKLQKNRSHPVWFKAEIIRSLPKDAKRVQATFQLDNCTITDTLKAGDISDTTNLHLSGSDLPPKVVAVMNALMGSHTEKVLKYSTISQIQYRGKVIYDKAAFMKRINEATEGGH